MPKIRPVGLQFVEIPVKTGLPSNWVPTLTSGDNVCGGGGSSSWR